VITNVYNLWVGWGSGYGVYTLSGGSIYIGANGVTTTSGSYAINLGGGTVGAETSWSSSLNLNLTNLNGSVTFNPAGNTITLSGALSGNGGLTVAGGGTLELSGTNTYSGDTIVSAGSTLQLDVTGSSVGAFRLANGALLNLNFSGDFAVAGFYTNGVALSAGTYNASNLPGFLTGSGSVQVAGSIPTTPTSITFSVSGGNLAINWPVGYQGWVLQVQTNSLTTGLSTNWVDVPGSANVTSVNLPINRANPTVFYRLRYPAQ
jgi:autotransporter-associated beta strand protein